jgi:hypothetical protein
MSKSNKDILLDIQRDLLDLKKDCFNIKADISCIKTYISHLNIKDEKIEDKKQQTQSEIAIEKGWFF